MSVIVRLDNVSKTYGDIKAVQNITFELHAGEIMGFLGPNGAGKTTTMKMITGYMTPDSGTISINGFDIMKESVRARKLIGYLPESNPLYLDMTVEEYLLFISRMRGLDNPQKAMRDALLKCGIDNVSHRIIGHLSKGYKQRVGLAQAIIHDPEILILDEPVNGLDPKQITEIRALIKKLGEEKTVILCSHILSEVEAVADRVLIVNDGCIVADDTMENLRERSRGNNIIMLELIKPAEGVTDNLSQISSVIKVENVEPLRFKITASGEKETASEIFKMAADLKWSLCQLYIESGSLEEMFLSLINGGN